MKDGKTLRGLVVSETAQSVVLKTAAEPEPVTVAEGPDREAVDGPFVDHAGGPARQGDGRGGSGRHRVHHADGREQSVAGSLVNSQCFSELPTPKATHSTA